MMYVNYAKKNWIKKVMTPCIIAQNALKKREGYLIPLWNKHFCKTGQYTMLKH